MKKSVYLMIVVTGLSLNSTAQAWSSKGHQTVGAIADSLLVGTPAEAHVKAILHDDESLMSISIWADCVKNPKSHACASDYKAHNQEWDAFHQQVGNEAATKYHFADVDSNSTTGYIFNPNQHETDVVHGIRESIAVLSDDTSSPNPHKLDKRQALWLLTHLLGDLHQPLHIGVLSIKGDVNATLGGNWLYPDTKSCLHANWDDEYLSAAMTAGQVKTPSAYAHYLLQKYQTQPVPKSDAAISEWPVQWANQVLSVAHDRAFANVSLGEAYNGNCGRANTHAGWLVTLPTGYADMASATAEQQVWIAGQRLAATLQTIWPH